MYNDRDETKKTFETLFPFWSPTVLQITIPDIFTNEVL